MRSDLPAPRQRGRGARPDRRGLPFEQHVAVSVDDLDDVVRRLVEQGHPWAERGALYGARRGMTADPEGNAVEVIEATGPFA